MIRLVPHFVTESFHDWIQEHKIVEFQPLRHEGARQHGRLQPRSYHIDRALPRKKTSIRTWRIQDLPVVGWYYHRLLE